MFHRPAPPVRAPSIQSRKILTAFFDAVLMAARYCVSFKTGDCLSLDSIGLAAVVEPAISEVDARFMEPVTFFRDPSKKVYEASVCSKDTVDVISSASIYQGYCSKVAIRCAGSASLHRYPHLLSK
jgi:hypothetical protein